MHQRAEPDDADTLRDDILRLTAIGGVVLAVVGGAYVLTVIATLGPWTWLTRFSWRPTAALQSAGIWLNLAGIPLLLVGSLRLWRGLRRGDRSAGGRLTLAYAITTLAGRWCFYLSGVLDTDLREPDRTWLIVGGLAEALTYSVFPMVVLVVLLRLAPPPPKADAWRGFEVVSPGGDS